MTDEQAMAQFEPMQEPHSLDNVAYLELLGKIPTDQIPASIAAMAGTSVARIQQACLNFVYGKPLGESGEPSSTLEDLDEHITTEFNKLPAAYTKIAQESPAAQQIIDTLQAFKDGCLWVATHVPTDERGAIFESIERNPNPIASFLSLVKARKEGNEAT